MLRLFKKKSEIDILNAEYQKLVDKSYRLSTVNRMESDKVAAEAAAILDKIALLKP